jgi:hypothetical protein
MFIQLAQIYEATKVLCDHQSSMKIYRRLTFGQQQQDKVSVSFSFLSLFSSFPLHNILPYQLIYVVCFCYSLSVLCVLLNTVAAAIKRRVHHYVLIVSD